MDLLARLGVAVVVFVSTNLDDILLLAIFFADGKLRPRNVVAGQFLGIGTLVAASSVAALAALVVPEGWIALLGLVPLALGLRRLADLVRAGDETEEEEEDVRSREISAEKRLRSQVLAVSGVTIANGGDNLGVYIPLFASEPRAIPIYAAVFAILTALWCGLGWLLVNNRVLGAHLRRYGHLLLPFVLIGLGLFILSDALVLVR